MARTCVFDDCYLCHWLMRGADQERWCGAGRPEFSTGDSCPMAMLKYEVCIDKDDKAHGHLLEIGPINGDQMHLDYQLRWDVRRWLDESIPGVTEWVNDMGYDRHGRSEVYVLITFPSKEAATLFKMWWM